MKKKKKIVFSILLIVAAILLAAIAYFYVKFSAGNFIADSVSEEINITLPKSEVFKVTSTAKGDNQSKIARLGEDVFTFYLDNSGCSDPSARGNDKTMQLLHIQAKGEVTNFDSIPVWMHGNVLIDAALQRIYYTTYEEVFEDGQYLSSVKIYTYSFDGETVIRTNEKTLADDRTDPFEANPRVGADIDENGNIAVAFSNYTGTMFIHVYDKSNDMWIKQHVDYYLETYLSDCNLYPYVRISGTDCIKIVSNRDTSTDENGNQVENLRRDYTRYFSYNGSDWSHFVLVDLRDEDPDGTKGLSAAPLDLFIDGQQTAHIFTVEKGSYHYYTVNSANEKTEISFPKLKQHVYITFIRVATAGGKQYYVVSGIALKGFKQTGYLEIYDVETQKMIYSNNSVCNQPYVYINKTDSDYLDIMVISRDKNYAENSDTHYIQLKI